MAEPAKQLEITQEEKNTLEIKKRIFETHTEELIIGLCGPIGTEIHFVAQCLNDLLVDGYNYKCQIIKLSDLIKRHSEILQLDADDYNFTIKKK